MNFPKNLKKAVENTYGERWRGAYKMFREGHEVNHLAVTREHIVEVSGIVDGETGTYACYVDVENSHCTCKDRITRGKIYKLCKHLLLLLLTAYDRKVLTAEDVSIITERHHIYKDSLNY